MDQAEQLLETVLVLRAQCGDGAALEELVHRYDSRLRYYLRRLLGDREHADDVAQEVWLAAIGQLKHICAPEVFRVWLFRVARNKAVSRLREESRKPLQAELPQVSEEDLAEDWTPADAAAVHAALLALSAEHREVLTLRVVEGMSYEQIALVVGCSLGTVRSRLHYAKRALRAELTGAEPAAPQTALQGAQNEGG